MEYTDELFNERAELVHKKYAGTLTDDESDRLEEITSFLRVHSPRVTDREWTILISLWDKLTTR